MVQLQQLENEALLSAFIVVFVATIYWEFTVVFFKLILRRGLSSGDKACLPPDPMQQYSFG